LLVQWQERREEKREEKREERKRRERRDSFSVLAIREVIKYNSPASSSTQVSYLVSLFYVLSIVSVLLPSPLFSLLFSLSLSHTLSCSLFSFLQFLHKDNATNVSILDESLLLCCLHDEDVLVFESRQQFHFCLYSSFVVGGQTAEFYLTTRLSHHTCDAHYRIPGHFFSLLRIKSKIHLFVGWVTLSSH